MICTFFGAKKRTGIAQHGRLGKTILVGEVKAEVSKVVASLCSLSKIELQQPTQPFSTFDSAFFQDRERNNEIVSDPLVITFQMVMSGILFEYVVKRPQAEENHSVQAFGFNRQDKPLGESVQIWRTRW